MNVVATAPMPGIITPSLPFAGAICVALPESVEDFGAIKLNHPFVDCYCLGLSVGAN
jgi:hypothetical protein